MRRFCLLLFLCCPAPVPAQDATSALGAPEPALFGLPTEPVTPGTTRADVASGGAPENAATGGAPKSTSPATAAPVILARPVDPLADALGHTIDPPVCCQLAGACSAGSNGARPAEVRSLCLAADGQPLTGQFCHSDGACRP